MAGGKGEGQLHERITSTSNNGKSSINVAKKQKNRYIYIKTARKTKED